jgi:hypothetical protein
MKARWRDKEGEGSEEGEGPLSRARLPAWKSIVNAKQHPKEKSRLKFPGYFFFFLF